MPEITERYRIVGENAVGATFNQILRQSKSTADRMSAVFKTAFAGVSLLTLGASVKQAIDRADEIGTLAKAFRVSTEELSRLDYVAKQSNSSLEEVTSGLTALQKNLALAAEDSGRARKAIAALGVDADELARMPLPRQLEAIAERFALVERPAQRVRIAAQLFGDEVGRKMIPVLELGAEGIRRLGLESDELGATLTAEVVNKLQKADEAIKRSDAAWMGLKTNLAVFVTPAIEAAGKAFETLANPKPDLALALVSQALLRIERTAQLAGKSVEELLGPGTEAFNRYSILQQQLGLFYSTPTNREHQEVLEDLGETAEETAERLKTLAEARRELMSLGDPVARANAQYEQQKLKIEELAKKYPALASVAQASLEAIRLAHVKNLAEAREQLALMNITLVAGETHLLRTARAADALRAAMQSIRESGQGVQGLDRIMPGATDAANDAELARRFEAIRRENVALQERTVQVREVMLDTNDAAKDLMTTLKDEGARRAFDAISGAIYNMGSGMKDFAKSTLDAFRRIVSDYATQQLFKLFAGGFGGGGGGGGGLLGALAGGIGSLFGGGGGIGPRVSAGGSSGPGLRFAGFRAGGGRIGPNEFGVVGEHEPELAFGGSAGMTIAPLSKLRGQGTSVSIDARTTIDARGASVELIDRLPGILRERDQALEARVETRIVERIRRRVYDLG